MRSNYRVPFWDRKLVTSTGCWEWVGSKRHRGYGQCYYKGRRAQKAHRIAWELSFGPIPKGLCVLHKCDNPPCINPEHLFLGTQLENIADMESKGRRGKMGKPKQQAKCHPDKPNHSRGLCKICNQRRLRAEKKNAN